LSNRIVPRAVISPPAYLKPGKSGLEDAFIIYQEGGRRLGKKGESDWRFLRFAGVQAMPPPGGAGPVAARKGTASFR
jgi:hypothetical protein